ncbi:MAG: RCC1 domain-containing protein [Gemmatimonadaceae bacterium]
MPWPTDTKVVVVALGAVFTLVGCTEPKPPAVELAFVVQPVTTTRAEPFTPAIQVEARDASGRRVTDWNGDVTIALDTSSSVFLGRRTERAVQGLATFPNLGLLVAGTGLRLMARGAGLRVAVSDAFTVLPGPPARLAFVQQPGNGRVSRTIKPDVVVEVTDAGGYRNTTGSFPVTLSLGVHPTGATLGGTAQIASMEGVATFTDITLDRSGTYALQATAPGLTAASSPSFDVRGVFASVTAGYFHSCGLQPDGSAYCWGDVGLPTRVSTEIAFTSLTSGRDARCGVTQAGAAYCWEGAIAPGLVPDNNTFVAAVAGYSHHCGVTSTGVAYCWGSNDQGQLGDGTFGGSRSSLVPVAGDRVFAQVSPGRLFSCGITTGAVAYCWGNNQNGMLGAGVQGNSAVPVAVTGNHTFATIGAGGFHACALTTAGAAYCWGSNFDGQLGDGTMEDRGEPVAVVGGLAFASLSVGNRHTCALTSDGTAYCWGGNQDGMLGDNTQTRRPSPTPVAGGLKFTSVRAGRFHTCGVATDGETYCWGSNNSGLLGGEGGSTATPRLVP